MKLNTLCAKKSEPTAMRNTPDTTAHPVLGGLGALAIVGFGFSIVRRIVL